ncbi:MAG: tetratricopeptide repeat protein, partial [Chryseolinea sp.]
MSTRSFTVIFAAFLLSSNLFGQKLDSLNAVLDTAKSERKVKTLNELFGANVSSNPIKALGYAREALNLATEINDKKGMGAAYNNLGIIYRNQGALEKALEYYLASLKIYESLDNKVGVASSKNNISTIYSIKQDYAEAMKYLEDSYNIFKEIGDQDRIIGSLNNLGILNTEIQLNDKAMKYFLEASELSEKAGKKFADPYNNVGNIFFNQGNYQRAVEFYERALTIERDNNNKLGILDVATNLGITYAKAKQPKPAKVYLDEALALSEALQAYTVIPMVYKAIASNEANMNRYQEAYEMELKYDNARDKIYGEESSRKIAQMEMVIEFQDKEKEYDLLKTQSEIDKLELRNSRLVILLIIIGGLGILGGFNFYYINKKKSSKGGRGRLAKA